MVSANFEVFARKMSTGIECEYSTFNCLCKRFCGGEHHLSHQGNS